MRFVTEPAPAKVNLFLRVVGRRDDGYHLLESLAVFAGAQDTVRAAPASELTLCLGGPFASGLQAEPDNLVLCAARALARHAGVSHGAALTLDKHLPIASGIGGGSADAAAALRALARLWGVGAVPLPILVGLGADVPVCGACLPAMMRGIGEALSAAPSLPAYGLVLINPGVAVSTPSVFRARAPGFAMPAALPAAWSSAASLAADCAALGNDLQAPAVALCPSIGDVLACLRALPGCLLAQMSGSGATCFGLFATPEQAVRQAQTVTQPGWWVWGGAPFKPAASARGLPQPAGTA